MTRQLANFPHLAQRLFNTPLALHPGKAEVVMAALSDHFGLSNLLRPDGSTLALSSFDLEEEAEAAWTPYRVIEGVAIIQVEGTLVHKLGTLRPYSGMTGYDGIRANLSMARNDASVRALMFDIDSGGGEVAGCFDLADEVHAIRGDKPMWSVLSESAFSAAYALASATDRIIVPRTGGTGSVGIISLNVDLTRALDKDGIDVTLITYGDQKADGHPASKLSEAALARRQADVNTVGDLFVETVARNRKLAASKVKATQAGTFLGAKGVEVGFADAVMSPSAAFHALLAELG
jgi:ClpP class serine protease